MERLEAIVPPRCILTDLSYSYKHAVGSQSEFFVLRVLNRHLISAAQYLGVGQAGFHYIPCTGYPSRMLWNGVSRPQIVNTEPLDIWDR